VGTGVARGQGKDGVFPRPERAGLDGDVLEEGGREGGREGCVNIEKPQTGG